MLSFVFFWLIQIILGYLLADLIVGIYHWIKDTYFDPHTPVIGKLFIWGSRLHHIRPNYVCTFTDFELFLGSTKWVFLWMAPLFYYIGINPFLLSLFLLTSANDIIHKYAHMLDHERPQLMTTLQQYWILQTREEHCEHHISPHTVNYCPITPYLNIVLEKINFWRNLENLIEKNFGVKPRAQIDEYIEDTSYPAKVKFIKI